MRKTGLWLLWIGWVLSTPSFGKIILLQDRAHARRLPGIAEVLHQIGVKLVDPSIHPAIPLVQKEVLALTEKIENPAEKNLTIYLGITRSAAVNAGFLNLGGNRRLVILNMGLLHFLEDDSEAVFVQGHEFEHGWSSIDRYRQKFPNGSLLYSVLQRPVENEVDGKSVFLRMLPIGADPYASGRFMRRMRSEFGGGESSISETHTGFGSREDTNALSITVARRELGRDIDWTKVPALSSGLVKALRETGLTQEKYLQGLYPDLEKDFGGVQAYVREYFALRTHAVSEKWQTRTSPIELPRQVHGLTGFQEWDWNRSALSQLPRSVQVVDYQRLHKAHIRAVGQAWTQTAQRYAVAPTEGRDVHSLLDAMYLPHHENTVASLEQTVERTRESIVEFEKLVLTPDKDIESNTAYLQELRERLEGELQRVELAKELASTWEEQSEKLRAAKSLFLVNNAAHCDTHSGVSPIHIVEVIGTPYESKVWELAAHYAAHFDGAYLEGMRSFSDPLFWRRLYELDREKALPIWESFLVQSIRNQKGKGIYSENALRFPQAIRTELENFKALPEFEQAYRRLLRPASLEFLQAQISKQQNKDIWGEKHPGYTLQSATDALLKTLDTARDFQAAGMLEPVDVQSFDEQHFAHIQTLLRKTLATVPAEYRADWSHEENIFHRAIALQLHEPLRTQTLAKLKAGSDLRSTVIELSHLCSNEFIRINLREAGFYGFYSVLRALDPKTPQQNQEFFETLYRLSQAEQISKYRPKEPNLPFLDPQAELYAGYVQWLIENHPEQRTTILDWFNYPKNDNSYSYPSNLSPEETEAIKAGHEAFNNSCAKVRPKTLYKLRDEFIRAETRAKMGADGRDVEAGAAHLSIEFSEQLRPNVSQYITLFDADRPRALRVFAENGGYAMDDNGFSGTLFQLMEEQLEASPGPDSIEQLTLAYLAIAKRTKIKNVKRDAIFSKLWDKGSENDKRLLATPKILAGLLTHEPKRRVVLWKIENDVHPEQVAAAADLTSIRPEVAKVQSLLETLLPEVSDLRDELVDELGNDLVTNPAETDALYSLCTNADNWFENEGLAVLDLPEHFQKLFSKKKEKLGFVQLLTGQITAEQLRDLLGDRMGISPAAVLLGLQGMEVRFRESSALIRTYVMLAFLDDLHGLLSDEENTEKIYGLLLGDFAHNKIVRAGMKAYFGAIHSSEKRVLIARVLAGMIDNPKSSKGFVRRIVDGLKTLGYKGAQFMLAAGMVSPDLEEEFEGVFDRAIKPRRDRALARVREAFGADLPGVKTFGSLLGYGSVNFVLGMDFDDEGITVEGAFRGQHENVVGQIRNEAQVWSRAIPALETDPDADVRLMGNYLRDALDAAMETLKEGGSEVDLAADREQIRQATPIYRRAPEQTRSGYAVEVVPVLERIQSRVSPAMSSQASIHPRIEVQSIPAHAKAAPLAEDALEDEMTAAYQHGIFDLDGHPGNWLVEDRTRTLWRTDVSQLRHAPEQTAQQRRISRALLKPFLGARDRKELVELAPVIFQHPGVELETLRAHFHQLLQAHGTPEPNPIANLYFYRRKLQQVTGANVKFTPQMVWYIQTVARNRTHIDTVGRWRFYRALHGATGASTASSAVGFVLHGARNCAKAVLGRTAPE